LIQDQRISVTKRSTNLIKEYRNYLWKEDKDGKILNVPEDMFNHCMDAVRYGMRSILKEPTFKMPEQSQPAEGYYPELEI